MTARDRLIIVVVLVGAALAGFWFVGLAPKRKEAADLRSQIDVAQQQLDQAQQQVTQARRAKAGYDADYAAVAALGKAVPKSDGLPSLIKQLQSAASGSHVDLRSLKVTQSGSSGSTPSSSSSGSASPSGSSAPSSGSAASSTANLPPGASIGSAGVPTMSFSFVFNGSFFDMERFLRDIQRFVRINGERVDVRGRLLSVDGFSLSAGPRGFPSVTANITATAYLRGSDDDGASTAGAGSTAGTSTASSAGSGGTASPAAPTATATGVAR